MSALKINVPITGAFYEVKIMISSDRFHEILYLSIVQILQVQCIW